MKNQTIFDYVKKYGQYSFVAMPFNEVDAAILATLSYINLGAFVPSLAEPGQDVVLSSLDREEDLEILMEGTVTTKMDRRFFHLCAQSKRFGNVQMNYVLHYFDKEKAIQFFAITFLLDNGFACVTYRGTDSSMVGWKEDLMMALDDRLPSYLVADQYLTAVSELLFEHPLIVTGHSKGGALAIYAATFVSEEIQNRVIRVYDLDGPGFKTALKENPSFERIYPKVIKIMPIDSVIGVLLETSSKVKIIQAKSFSIFQHSAYNWFTQENHFARAKKLTKHSLALSVNMREFISRLNEEEKKNFIETLFSIIDSSHIYTIHDFGKHIDKNIYLAVKSISAMLKDEEKSTLFKKVIREYIQIYLGNIGKRIEISDQKEPIDIIAEIVEKNS